MSATADENTRNDRREVAAADGGGVRPRIDLDDGRTWPGSAVTAEARVTMAGSAEVQAVIQVQGLEPAWCPPPQVVTVVPGVTTRLYVKLTPPPGTPPGRYLWSLTAQVPDQPMLAVTAELQVGRPPATAPAPRRSRWRPIALLLATAIGTLLLAVTALTRLAPARLPWAHPSATRPAPAPTAPGLRHRIPRPRPGAPAPSVSATAEELVRLHGTVLVGEEKVPTRITVIRLTLDDLAGVGPSRRSASAGRRARAVGTEVHGEHWSLSLPPGLYGLTFSKRGFTSESIVVATSVAGILPPPQVHLVRIAPLPTGKP
jgi:hypothetical protein